MKTINFNLPFGKQLSNDDMIALYNGSKTYFEFYVNSYSSDGKYLDNLNKIIIETIASMNLSDKEIKKYDRSSKHNLANNILTIIETNVLLAFQNSNIHINSDTINIKVFFEDVDKDINFTLIKEYLEKNFN